MHLPATVPRSSPILRKPIVINASHQLPVRRLCGMCLTATHSMLLRRTDGKEASVCKVCKHILTLVYAHLPATVPRSSPILRKPIVINASHQLPVRRLCGMCLTATHSMLLRRTDGKEAGVHRDRRVRFTLWYTCTCIAYDRSVTHSQSRPSDSAMPLSVPCRPSVIAVALAAQTGGRLPHR